MNGSGPENRGGSPDVEHIDELSNPLPNAGVSQEKEIIPVDLLKYIAQRVDQDSKPVEKVQSASSKFARIRISDGIFRTFSAVRAYLKSINLQGDVLIPFNEDLNQSDDESLSYMGVDFDVAIALVASAQVADDWKKNESDPVKAGIEKAEKLIKDLPTDSKQITLDALYLQNPVWAGLAPLCDARNAIIDLLSSELSPFILESNKRGAIEATPPDSNEHTRITNIIRFMLDRLEELCGEETERIRNEMRNWRRWSVHQRKATLEDLPGIQGVYERVLIPTKTLLQLVSTVKKGPRKARDWIEEFGGFLRHPTEKGLRDMIKKGHTRVLINPKGQNPPLLGYYSVVSDTKEVKHELSEMCGFVEGQDYTEQNLPQRSSLGWKMTWLKPREATDFLNEPEAIAITQELAVRHEHEEGSDVFGGATALKFAVHEEIPKDKPLVMTRYFEIVEINGERVSNGGVVNIPSRTFINELGATLIATAEDTFERDGVHVKAIWYLCLSDVDETIERIKEKSPEQQ